MRQLPKLALLLPLAAWGMTTAWATDIDCAVSRQPAARIICDHAVLNKEYEKIYAHQQAMLQDGKLSLEQLREWQGMRDECTSVRCIDRVFAQWDATKELLKKERHVSSTADKSSRELDPSNAVLAASESAPQAGIAPEVIAAPERSVALETTTALEVTTASAVEAGPSVRSATPSTPASTVHRTVPRSYRASGSKHVRQTHHDSVAGEARPVAPAVAPAVAPEVASAVAPSAASTTAAETSALDRLAAMTASAAASATSATTAMVASMSAAASAALASPTPALETEKAAAPTPQEEDSPATSNIAAVSDPATDEGISSGWTIAAVIGAVLALLMAWLFGRRNKSADLGD